MRNRILSLIQDRSDRDPNTLFITGDLGFSVVEGLRQQLGDRFINAGVSEANMISMAAGLASTRFIPFVYSIAPFVTFRCLEQIRNDLCYANKPVRLIGVGAGFSYGTLGPSHHSLDDLQVMSALPNLLIISPSCVDELNQLFILSDRWAGPVYFRLGKDRGPDLSLRDTLTRERPLSVLRDGSDANVLVTGSIVEEVLIACDRLSARGLSVKVMSVPVLAPFPTRAVIDELREGPTLVVAEAYEGHPLFAGTVAALLQRKVPCAVAVDSAHVEKSYPKRVGDQAALRQLHGLDAASLERRLNQLIDRSRISR